MITCYSDYLLQLPAVKKSKTPSDTELLDWLETTDRPFPVKVTNPDPQHALQLGWWNVGKTIGGQHLFPTLREAVSALMRAE